MSSALIPASAPIDPVIMNAVMQGNLIGLSSPQRLLYRNLVCERIGLDPLMSGLEYVDFRGKTVLYATKATAEQLRKINGVSIVELTHDKQENVYIVTVKASDKTGRTDASTAAIDIGGLKGEALANALMKTETKAKRRVTLSICALGMLDETEVETIPQALVVKAPPVDVATPLPAGAVRILSVKVTDWGGDVEVVDEHGETTLWKTSDRQCAELAEQMVQAGVPVILGLQTITRGVNKGKQKLASIHRVTTPAPQEEPKAGEAITADDVPF